MDTLGPCSSVKSVAILPTSTSNGGDACLVVDTIADVKGLKGKKVFGLANSVSEYCFVRCLQTLGENPADYAFEDMGPGEAAMALIQKQPNIEAIMVWNPFVLQTLDKRKDVKTLFDSSKIPGEIIDMVIMSQDSLSKPGGEAFACAVIDAYYQLNARLADPATRDQSLLAISEKFAAFDVKTMEKVVTQTQFYATADAGISVLTSDVTQKNMEGIVAFFLGKKVIETAPEIGYGDKASAPNAAFRFDPTFIKKVSEKK
jgi:NitT/TauT family transport system substrate-binding protein